MMTLTTAVTCDLALTLPVTAAGRRIDALEQRLMAAEQANRSLLDELMRMQQDTKVRPQRSRGGTEGSR